MFVENSDIEIIAQVNSHFSASAPNHDSNSEDEPVISLPAPLPTLNDPRACLSRLRYYIASRQNAENALISLDSVENFLDSDYISSLK